MIRELKSGYLNFRNNFNNNVKDSFGKSIDNEHFEPIQNSLEMCIMQEEKIELEIVYLNKLLFEARTILPDLGF